MLLFSDLINYLCKNQVKIESHKSGQGQTYIQQIDNSMKKETKLVKVDVVGVPAKKLRGDIDLLNLPESLRTDICELFCDYFTVKVRSDCSFIYSVLYLIDETFIENLNKEEHINALRKKLAFALDDKHLHKKFGYVKKREYKKDLLKKELLSLKGEVSESVQKYICDFFGINVYVFCVGPDNSFTELISIFSAGLNEEITYYNPSCFILRKADKYTPILNNSGEGIFTMSKTPLLQQIINEHFKDNLSCDANANNDNANANDAKANDAKAIDAKAIDAKANDAKANDAKANDAKANDAKANDANANDAKAIDANAIDAKAKLKNIKTYSLQELQEMAKSRGILIEKGKYKNGSISYKTKTELYDELNM